MADELFDEASLDSKMDFLQDKPKANADGLYRIDVTKASDPKRGYMAKIRLLPNLKKDGTLGQSAIEKISHWVNIRNVKEISGMYDSPKNFGEKCPLSDLFYTLKDSKNAILQEKAKMLKYSKKYYSYILVIEDEIKENVGKIFVFQYGKTLRDKILQEKNGEISESCKVFDLANGKNLKLIVKQIKTGDEIYPDYKSSAFESQTSSLPIYKNGTFKNVPVVNGKIDPKFHKIVKEFLAERDHELEEFEPKRLTEEQHGKINEIISYLSGKSTPKSQQNNEDIEDDNLDFHEESVVSSGSKADKSDENADDFFEDFN